MITVTDDEKMLKVDALIPERDGPEGRDGDGGDDERSCSPFKTAGGQMAARMRYE